MLSYVEVSALTALHLFPHRDEHLAFHPDTFSLFRVSPLLSDALSYLKRGHSVSDVSSALAIEPYLLMARLGELQTYLDKATPAEMLPQDEDPQIREVSLTMHVSNACNLACDYCYADGGDYGRPTQARMEIELALKTVDKMYENFPHIGNLMFFGGEPLLAINVIDAICDHINDKFDRGEIKGIPEYTMVSNGTLVNDEAIRLLKKHLISVTVSIDGPKAITDRLRPYKGGQGSFDAIHKGFHRIVNEVGRIPQVEATYTKAHQDAGMSMGSLIDFLQKEYMFSVGTVATVEVPPGHELELPEEQTKSDVHNLFENMILSLARGELPKMEQSLLSTMLQFVKKRRSRFICSIGHDAFNVTTDGEVFPCQVFIKRPEFSLGRIEDLNMAAPTTHTQSALDRLRFRDKERNPICSGCWVKDFCTSCPGSHTFSANNDNVPDHFCTGMREWIQKVLGVLYDLRKDKKLWNQFLTGLVKLGAELESQGRTRSINVDPMFTDSACQSTAGLRPRLYQIAAAQAV